MGEREKALEQWQTILSYDENYVSNYPLRDAHYWNEQGVFSSAEHYYEIAVQLAPENLEALKSLAKLYAKEQMPQKAFSLLDNYFETHQDFLPVLGLYYELCVQTEDWQQLERVRERSMESNPVMSLRILQNVYVEYRQFDKAIEVIGQLAQLSTREKSLCLTLEGKFRILWSSGALPSCISNWRESKTLLQQSDIDFTLFLSQYVLHLPLMTGLTNANLF